MDDRLYRSTDDRVLTGVARGVAERLDTDPSIIRVVWALLVVLTGGLALIAYVVMAVVVPEEPDDRSSEPAGDPAGGTFGGGTGTGPSPDPATSAPDPDAPTAATPMAAAALTASSVTAATAGPGATGAPVTSPASPSATGGWVAPDGQTVTRASGPPSDRKRRSGAGARDDRGALIGGLVLILIGGFFLVRQFLPAIDLGSWWPIILVGIGVILVVMSVTPGRRSD